jgi:diadenylate cyclase
VTVRDFFSGLVLADLVDILAVAVVVYGLLLVIRRTRAVPVLIGIVVLLAISFLSNVFALRTLHTLLQNLIFYLPFAAVVIFQDQIRRALASFGRTSMLGLGPRAEQESTFNEVVLAATALANRRMGALVVIERDEGLREFIEGGVELDAALSADLLINIFTPGAPLHDGAVIIRDDKVAAAACFLPLTRQTDLPIELGTRHRAALGISDETDAVAIVVSEETGRISAAHNGEITLDLDSRELRNYLYKHLVREPRADVADAKVERAT